MTDLTKEIDGVRTVVVWDRDYEDDELVEAELAFFAQADDGDIGSSASTRKSTEEGEFVDVPTWIHGIQDAQAGIIMIMTTGSGTPVTPRVGAGSRMDRPGEGRHGWPADVCPGRLLRPRPHSGRNLQRRARRRAVQVLRSGR